MNYYIPNELLTTNNAKTIKGENKGVITYIMYLAPHTQNSKGINLCSHASVGCAKACLFNSGSARFDAVQNGKINKTEYFINNRHEFLAQLDKELAKIEAKFANIDDAIPAIRLNGTADIRFEKFKVRDGKNLFELYPNLQFYDYTKNYLRFNAKLPSNYHLTFSMSETNKDKCIELLAKGVNVAMVFDTKRLDELPNRYLGYEIINGDESDLRFLDGEGVIVGLRYKNMTNQGKGANKVEIENNDFIINVEGNKDIEYYDNTQVA